MPTTRLRRYRHFSTVPDALALVKLLRRAAIAFETRYEQGANYDRARHEPDRLEVWIRAANYAFDTIYLKHGLFFKLLSPAHLDPVWATGSY